VANPDDTLSSADPAANLATPPPVPAEVEPAQERSGAISISGGDFATPMVRKRTITKPRGLPTVTPVDHAANVVTPPPARNGTPAPAPKPLGAAARQTQPRAASPVDPDATSLRGQASRLRATGLQPVAPPRAEDVPVTPPPPAVPAAVAKAPSAAVRRDTGSVKLELPSVDVDPGPTPPPVAAAPAQTPLPSDSAIPVLVEAAGEEPAVEESPLEVEHEAPEAHAASPLAEEPPVEDLASLVEPMIQEEPAIHEEPVLHEEPMIQEEPAIHEEPVLHEPMIHLEPAIHEEPVLHEEPMIQEEPAIHEEPMIHEEPALHEPVAADQGAIPSRPMHEGDSERNLSPLAHTLAHIAEEAQRRSEAGIGSDELASEDELELVDAPLDAPPTAPAVRPMTPPLPILPAAAYATPPPLPSILAKSSAPPFPTAPEGPPADMSGVVTPSSPLPEALAERPRRPKRSKPWFEEIFDEDYLRTLPFMTKAQTLREVAFIDASLEATTGAEILDVACGYGRHAIELVQKGLNVTGLDLSLPLLIKAADEAQRRSVAVNFVHADMREMPFDRKFDGAYCMLTSFGYFDEDANLKVAEGVARALKPGGRFLLDIVNRDYVVADLPTRIWWEGTGCVVLEEVDFNFHTSRVVTRRSVVFEDGRQLEQEISVRAYSLHELGRLLRQAGFRVLDISGSTATRGRFLGVNSRNLLVLAEKRSD